MLSLLKILHRVLSECGFEVFFRHNCCNLEVKKIVRSVRHTNYCQGDVGRPDLPLRPSSPTLSHQPSLKYAGAQAHTHTLTHALTRS